MKKGLTLVLTLVLVSVMAFASTALAADKTLTIMGVWGGHERDAFEKVIETFETATGIDVQFEGTRDLPTLLTTRLEAGNPPDIVALPNPGNMKELAAEGHLVDLRKVLDMDTLREDYGQTWIDLGSYNDGLYGIFISADVKSLVWYNPKQFEAKGYDIPKTWDEMERLMNNMVAKGDIPWSIGLESGAASGWPGTDWIEDIMLRTAGPEVYDQWVNHDIPWTDERVKKAFEIFGKIARNPKFTWGGPTAVLATNFGDAANPLFTNPPQAYMHRQASFITGFITDNNPDLVAGKDYNCFILPPINEEVGTPVLGAADMMGMINDTPEARAFMRYLASPGAQMVWIGAVGSKIGINKRIDLNVYSSELMKNIAKGLREADVFRFDGSDLMPKAVGSGAFWQGVMDYVGGQDLDSVLEHIESVADDAYDSGKTTD
ncbi:ABC transporter substrate-binding protein [Halothermothrix orenii]|uniref:Extracellular solute-binding protein family 1 n=1 Tax=Halothermothrix orenii (strain H 168 / OCM 544 / DSM 9562) TaxID=373903 RepID=B8CY35_HALOH|nr:ABC transporter substrate-binding protein [Halothermothrix orenii]ACL70204.1 extracellular solute-binding protein family 1 [Halothermothrix orenii H 168]